MKNNILTDHQTAFLEKIHGSDFIARKDWQNFFEFEAKKLKDDVIR